MTNQMVSATAAQTQEKTQIPFGNDDQEILGGGFQGLAVFDFAEGGSLVLLRP